MTGDVASDTPRPTTPRPDFFIVGAFKSGTTALYAYLRQHPQVFMPLNKEPHFFGDDLTRHYGRMSLAEYLALFRDARPGQRIGEASTWYLYSGSAAREIGDFSPAAQIIVMLRNPADVMYAQHSQLRFRADEPLAEFALALAAEPARRRGEQLPGGTARPETLFYRHSVRFSEQLERYFDVFGRDRVHVVLFDDLVADTAATYRRVLEFLGVDSEFRPNFAVYNPNKSVRFARLQRLVFSPPGPAQRLAGRLRHLRLVRRLRDMLLRLNSTTRQRPKMDPVLRSRLTAELRPDVERLARLIDRDLSAWSE
jgi:hypothetical protein